MILPTRDRGFSEANGSWNTIWMLARCGRISARFSDLRSVPLRTIRPSSASTSRTMQRATVDFPGAALADDAERLPPAQIERDVADGPDGALLAGEPEEATTAPEDLGPSPERPRRPPPSSGSLGGT